ncbi:hypothetical protein FRC05_009511, partial [Tulasnella sp. 425]
MAEIAILTDRLIRFSLARPAHQLHWNLLTDQTGHTPPPKCRLGHHDALLSCIRRSVQDGEAVLLSDLLKGSISLFIALLCTEPDTGRTRIATTSVPTAPKAEYTLLAKSKRAVAATSPPSLVCPTSRLIGRLGTSAEIHSARTTGSCGSPLILRVIQNDSQLVAASNLGVATFQMKILTTAGFSVLMLRKRLSTVEWLSLLGLAIRDGVLQIQTGAVVHRDSRGGDSVVKHVVHALKGFLAIFSAYNTSELAGIYFETVLKGSQSDLWIRNVNFPYPPPSGLRPCILLRKLDIGIFGRAVLELVFGGLVTVVVTKYADNIMKGFATSLIIIISFLTSVALVHFSITAPFIVGSSILLGATWVYNQPAVEKPREVVHENSGEDKRSGMRVSLSSLSLKGSGRKSANVPGSTVDPNYPILGDMNPKKKSSLPTPESIAPLLKASSAVLRALHPTVKEDTSPSRP